MRCQLVLPASLLLLWTLTAFVSCSDGKPEHITVTTVSGGIKLGCTNGVMKNGKSTNVSELTYSDDNTGEYTCFNGDDNELAKIFVKFRTCDNCVELDEGSIASIIAGDVVATIVIGVAVYLIASQARIGPTISHKSKSSDRQHLVPNEISNRAPNDHYQPLKPRNGQKDMYDVLNRK